MKKQALETMTLAKGVNCCVQSMDEASRDTFILRVPWNLWESCIQAEAQGWNASSEKAQKNLEMLVKAQKLHCNL